jgi:Family of unknown function (DUF6790)
MYIAVVALFMFLLPLGSAFAEHALPGGAPLMALIGKWFVFWAAGVRLVLAAVRQLFQPEFTARQIFKIEGSDALPLVREIGAANLALGAVGVASFWRPDFILPIALTAAIFYAIAGFRHALKTGRSLNETVAMASDLFVFIVLAAYAAHALL